VAFSVVIIRRSSDSVGKLDGERAADSGRSSGDNAGLAAVNTHVCSPGFDGLRSDAAFMVFPLLRSQVGLEDLADGLRGRVSITSMDLGAEAAEIVLAERDEG
jgi:hypothetical protein